MANTWIIGDIHGWKGKLDALLEREELVDVNYRWAAGKDTAVFIGDYVNRGPDGIGCIARVMQLQEDAAAAGGQVIPLIGNHDILLLAARVLDDDRFESALIENGGLRNDVSGLTLYQIDWLRSLPALAVVEDTLYLHADGKFYAEYGHTVAEVNTVFRHILTSDDADSWDRLLGQFAEHRAFLDEDAADVRRWLKPFGAQRLVHGHSPIYKIRGVPAEAVTGAMVYADGAAVNVDHCFYAGGYGFVFEA